MVWAYDRKTKKRFKVTGSATGAGKLKFSEKKEIKKIVKRTINRNLETRYTTTNISNQKVDSTPTFYYCLTDKTQQGDPDLNRRQGDRIDLMNLQIRLQLAYPVPFVAGDDYYTIYRCLVFQSHEELDTNNAGTPATGSVLLGKYPLTNIFLVGGGGGGFEVTSLYNHDRKGKYTILYDKCFTMVNTDVGGAQNPSIIKLFKQNISLKRAKKRLQFVNGSQTLAGDHIFYVLFTNNVSFARSPTAYLSAKIEYKDA